MCLKKILTSSLLVVVCLIESYAKAQLVEMGHGSYGNPNVVTYGEGKVARVGRYCSIAGNVTIFVGGEHRPDWVTTYPFSYFWPHEAGHIPGHPKSKGDVVIGNDVWIGFDAFILSGVKVGDGAVIGAKAVVAKDVPPYAIVAGNPAKVIRYRFDPITIEKLLNIAWWNWPESEIRKAIPYLLSDDIQLFIEYCRTNGKI